MTVVALLLTVSSPAQSDGGMFPVLAGSGASADQRAVVAFDGSRETLILQTAYQGDGSDFAWVIPVPEQLAAGDIGTADPLIFDDLYDLTEPRARGGGGRGLLGCGSAGGQRLASVRVWETLHVDGYEVAILSAAESADLEAWLNQNGYAFPSGHQDALNYYVGKSWFFVAARMSPDASGQAGEARPLRLRFDAAEPVYPMRISAASSDSEVEVLRYVIAAHRVTSANYVAEAVRLNALYRGGDFGAYYEGQFRESLTRAGPGSLLVEYAGELPRYVASAYASDLGLGSGTHHVTRLRSYLQPHHMAEDIFFEDASSDEPFEVRVASAASPEVRVRLAHAGVLLCLAAMLGLASGNRRGLVRALLGSALIALLLL
ncbi:MAG: DUF2330 domain-containing protein [Armatimonadota bacterium]